VKSYSEILLEYENQQIPYSVLLSTEEWSYKRRVIIYRERNVCQVCHQKCIDDYLPIGVGTIKPMIIFVPGIYKEAVEEREQDYRDEFGQIYPNIPTLTSTMVLEEQSDPHFAHVHHTYYVMTKLPWEYPDKDLMLACHKCHTKIHETQLIKVYVNEEMVEFLTLTPCSRCNGTGHFPEYKHVENGICFRCRGACFDEWIV
jgi:hypothetical protein